MSYISNRDFLIEVRKGNVSGHACIHKFGRNDAVPNASWAHISLTPFAIANFRESAITMQIKAGGNAADDAGGNGAREVTIQGIDSNFDEITEVITTNGVLASNPTAASFWRVHRAWVSSAGTYSAANTAAIVIEDSGGGADYITIGIEEGQTQYTGWTVPIGKTAYLLTAHVTVDSIKAADIRMFTRTNIDDVAAPLDAIRLKIYWDGLSGTFRYDPNGPNTEILEKSDIWFEANGSGAQTEVSVDFELLVVDN